MSDTSVEAIEAAIRRVLTSHGPMPEDLLFEVLVADGVDFGPDEEDLLADILDSSDDLVMGLLDENFAFLPALFDGRVLTHRLTALEAEHDLLEWGPDISAVSVLMEDETYVRLTDGSPIHCALPTFDKGAFTERGVSPEEVAADAALLLPIGYFSALGLAAGDLIGLRVTHNGFHLTRVDAVTDTRLGAKIVEVVEEHAEGPMMLDPAVWTALASDADLLRAPATPLGEQLSTTGLRVHGEWVASNDVNFDGWLTSTRVREMKVRHGLTEEEAVALLGVIGLYERTLDVVNFVLEAPHVGDEVSLGDVAAHLASQQGAVDGEDDPEDTTAMFACLREPIAVQAFLAEISTGGSRAAIALHLFSESMERAAPRSARPAMRWLHGKALEALGSAEQAEETFRAAESLDPSWPLTLMSLARYASDRGDAVRGLTLLHRAGAPADHPLVQLLERFQTPAGPALGRNEQCWCGSGQKFKKCHMQRQTSPLSERAAWLYEKASSHLLDARWSGLLIETAYARSEYWETPDRLERALADGLACDAVLFEGGAFGEFVSTRASLLPPDEVMLAQQWLLVERSVQEVVSVKAGESITMRDVRTGDVQVVRERSASRQVRAGELYCARIVPAGETVQIFGGLEPVSLAERDQLIALLDAGPDPLELVAFLSRRFAPPVLLNSEGQASIMCDATLRVTDPASLAEALDGEYDRDPDVSAHSATWFEHITTQGLERIRAHLDLHNDQLHIHANSEERFESVLDTVLSLDPGATTVAETREPLVLPATRPPDRSGPAPSASPFGLPEDPAVVDALAGMVRQFEENWLDDHIPALGGHTPRECAKDPTRRPDLISLLNSFPQEDQPGQMSVSRLRSALGLE